MLTVVILCLIFSFYPSIYCNLPCQHPPQCNNCKDGNGNWLGEPWTTWTDCSSKCSSGQQTRQRHFATPFECCGCATLANPEIETRDCNGLNNCMQSCNEADGSCGCIAGYTLNSDERTCAKKSCSDISSLFSSCPASATDIFGNKCAKVEDDCTDVFKLESVCTLKCSLNFFLAKISSESDFESLSSVTVYGNNQAVCQSNNNQMEWSISDIPQLYCRRGNDPPKNILLSGTTLNEDVDVDNVVGDVSTIDDTNAFDYSVISGNQNFRIIENVNNVYQLVNKQKISLQKGGNGVLSVTIRSTDRGSPTMHLDKSFQITIINVNDAPEEITLSASSFPNSVPVDRTVGVFTAIDYDMENPKQTTIDFVWTLMDDSDGHFKVVDGNLQIAKTFDEDFSGLRNIEVNCTDKDQNNPKFSTKTFQITVTNENKGPQDLKLNFTSLKENQQLNEVIGFIEAIDKESDSIVFATTSEYFTLQSTKCNKIQSQVSCKANLVLSKQLNFEEKTFVELPITATDTEGEKEDEKFFIQVTDSNDPITNIMCMVQSNVPSNAPQGYFVGQVQVVDEDKDDKHTCEVVSPTNYFTFSTTSSILVNNRLDMTKAQYNIKVKCNDSGAFDFIKDCNFATSNPCSGRSCTRDPSLCNNVVCRTDEVCSTHINSYQSQRCIPMVNQMRLLLSVPPATFDQDYLFDLEEYIEKVLKGQANGLSLTNMKDISNVARKRRGIADNVELEAIRLIISSNFHLYISMIPRHDSTYELQQAMPLCELLEGSDVHCLSQTECSTLTNLGFPCPIVYANSNFGKPSATKTDDSSSNKSWLIGVIIGAFLLLVIIVVIIFFLRHRRKHEKLYDGGIVFNNSTNRVALRTPDNQFHASNNYSVPFEDKSYIKDVKKRNDIKVVNNDIYQQDLNGGGLQDGTFEVTNPAYGLSATNHAFDDSDEKGDLEVPMPHSPLYASVGKASGKSYDRIDIEDVAQDKAKEIDDEVPTTPTGSYDRLSTIDRHMSVNQYDPDVDDREKVVKRGFSEG